MHGPTYLRVQLLRSHGGSERKAYFFPAKERGELSFAVADTGMLAACFPTSDEGAEAREQYISPGIFFFLNRPNAEIHSAYTHVIWTKGTVAPPPTPKTHGRTVGGGAGCGIGGWRCVSSALQPVWVGLDKVGMLRGRGWVVP